MIMNRTLFLNVVLSLSIVIAQPLYAQDESQFEVVKMQKNATEAINRGDYNNAINYLSQAIRLAPSDVTLRRDLAYSYYLSGDLKKASSIITEVVNTDAADEPTYQIAAAIEGALGNNSKAKKILNTGISKYPQSALLYNNRGNIFAAEKKPKDAVSNWNKGIEVDPSFAANYYSLAKHYAADKPVWTLVYSEIFINLESDTKRTAEIKALLFKTYAMFFQISDQSLPAFKNEKKKNGTTTSTDFDEMYTSIMNKTVGALTNGINTESLIMLRTRFILEWRLNYAGKTPFTLFTYQDKLLKEGLFDAYNQWLFGAVENSSSYSIWLKNNSAIVGKMEKWKQNNPLQPASYDFIKI